MAFGGFSKGGDSSPMAEINMVPLIDVMLVLLVIFIITAPLLTHAVKIDLPKASSEVNQTKPDNVQLGIRAGGEIFWNGEEIEISTLESRFKSASHVEPQAELHIRADRKTEYRHVAEVMAMAVRAGLTRIGFVTEPGKEGP
jgi:biopolymer transport protein ExbD